MVAALIDEPGTGDHHGTLAGKLAVAEIKELYGNQPFIDGVLLDQLFEE